MPQYDFRCRSCRQSFSLFFKTYAAYDRAEPRCPACGAAEPSRVINRVSFAKAGRDYSGMSANEMLSVLEGGDEKQVDAMFRQVGASATETPPTMIPKRAENHSGDSPDNGKSTSSDGA